jgi:hypothetical protein
MSAEVLYSYLWKAGEIEQRKRVVAVAHSWIGTPYRHGARIKGVAADCTFFAKVYEEAGLVPEVPISVYSSNAHLHRASGQYLQHIRKYAHEVARDRVRPGDIAMFHIARDFSHGGIVNAHDWPEHVEKFDQAVGWPWIIHGDMGAGVIYEVRGDQAHLAMAREVKFFSLW